MKWHRAAMGWVAIFVAGFVAQGWLASAQTFDSYRCADGTHFILAFYPRRQTCLPANRWPCGNAEEKPDHIGQALFRQWCELGRYRRLDQTRTAGGDGVRAP
jgi:hypothetical protein